MNAEILRKQLNEASEKGDQFQYVCYEITNGLPASIEDIPLVQVILDFMEKNEELDYGSASPLARFAEKFYGRGYEKLLCESVSRQPTMETLLMLIRIINGTKDPQTRGHLIDVAKSVVAHPLADFSVQDMAESYLAKYCVA